MKKLTCFVLIPSNREKGFVELVQNGDRGWIELPAGCQKSDNTRIEVNFDEVYEEIIKAAINKVNEDYREQKIHIECILGKEITQAGKITHQLIEQICKADITITDVTTHNPNVFLEYGIRLAVRDSLNIMISHEKVVLPFDIQDLRCIRYSLGIKGANKARDEIAKFIRGYLSQLDSNTVSVESSDFYKRYVDLYSGRQLERELVSALETAPKLVADLAGFLLTGKKDPTLKQKVFKFFEAVEKVLRTDPKGHRRAIEHFELVSHIKGLPTEKLQETYYALWELCDTDDNLKEQAAQYLERIKELEE